MLNAPEPTGTEPFTLDRFFTQLTRPGTFSLVDLGVALLLGTLLTLAMVQTYRTTHRGATYSVAFIQSLFILACCTTLIMVVIGSNIARAFSLVGALSIIRFRTAIKDPRDVAFVFATIAIGMGCGTAFYGATIIFTVFVCALLLVLSKLNVGESRSTDAILRVTVAAEDAEATIGKVEGVVRERGNEPALVNRVTDAQAGEQTLSWRIRTGPSAEVGALQEAVATTPGVVTVGVFTTDDFHVL